MLEKAKWYNELITLLYLSDKFGSFGLDFIMRDAAEYYDNGLTPRDAAQFIIKAVTDTRALGTIIGPDTDTDDDTPLSWEEQNLLPLGGFNH